MTSITLQEIICGAARRNPVFKTDTSDSLSRIVRTTRISGIHQARKPSPNG